MSNTIYVGNVSYEMTSEELKEIFTHLGSIEDAKIVQNRFNGRSRGFGFVTFATAELADQALELNGKEVKGRKLFVNIAREKTEQEGQR